MTRDPYLTDALRQLRKLRALADAALEQITDEQWFVRLDPESNSIAHIVKHLAGNMRSRWTDFLTTDGEKPERDRDREFELGPGDTVAALRERWEDGWRRCFAAIEPLTRADLFRTVTVRGEPHTVLEAISRQLTHYAQHVGQIVLLAKHFAGPAWRTLSIPRGRSSDFDVSKDGVRYRVSEGGGGTGRAGALD
ncbi:MAG TPA: DUF1572 family protein [Gemmatimonadales bacterium]|nr:DUF1572 family protein [Gemmatimonadales bacterium]